MSKCCCSHPKFTLSALPCRELWSAVMGSWAGSLPSAEIVFAAAECSLCSCPPQAADEVMCYPFLADGELRPGAEIHPGDASREQSWQKPGESHQRGLQSTGRTRQVRARGAESHRRTWKVPPEGRMAAIPANPAAGGGQALHSSSTADKHKLRVIPLPRTHCQGAAG